MATYIGLLRAVNLPGHNKIAMADLRDVLTRLGMRDVVTLLQSGNFVCRSDVRSSPELERLIEGGGFLQALHAAPLMKLLLSRRRAGS